MMTMSGLDISRDCGQIAGGCYTIIEVSVIATVVSKQICSGMPCIATLVQGCWATTEDVLSCCSPISRERAFRINHLVLLIGRLRSRCGRCGGHWTIFCYIWWYVFAISSQNYNRSNPRRCKMDMPPAPLSFMAWFECLYLHHSSSCCWTNRKWLPVGLKGGRDACHGGYRMVCLFLLFDCHSHSNFSKLFNCW